MAGEQVEEVTDTGQAPDATEAPEAAPAPDTAQALVTTTQVTEMVACQCRSTYHWRHGGGGCPNPARWCQWCKDGGCVLARQADAARESRRSGSSSSQGGRRSSSRRRRHRRSRGPGLPVLPLPPVVPFPMLPMPPLPFPMSMPGADFYRGRDASDASSSSSSRSSSSGGRSSDDGRRDSERLSLQLYRPHRMGGGCGGN